MEVPSPRSIYDYRTPLAARASRPGRCQFNFGSPTGIVGVRKVVPHLDHSRAVEGGASAVLAPVDAAAIHKERRIEGVTTATPSEVRVFCTVFDTTSLNQLESVDLRLGNARHSAAPFPFP
ncbi:hypothetical protein [Mycobacteroides abscessus]|uniref:hypothetical protein n=1 Tax=Mycobacteroides abscessus TaxID=36809 RepID=UPI0011C392B8|nr:hypothetical protein [Mycobacteroides abscessus]